MLVTLGEHLRGSLRKHPSIRDNAIGRSDALARLRGDLLRERVRGLLDEPVERVCDAEHGGGGHRQSQEVAPERSREPREDRPPDHGHGQVHGVADVPEDLERSRPRDPIPDEIEDHEDHEADHERVEVRRRLVVRQEWPLERTVVQRDCAQADDAGGHDGERAASPEAPVEHVERDPCVDDDHESEVSTKVEAGPEPHVGRCARR